MSFTSPALDYITLKVVLVGYTTAGKTNLMKRFTDDIFDPTLISTIGVDFAISEVLVPGGSNRKDDAVPVKLQVWDTNGHTNMWRISQSYVDTAQGLMFVVNMTDRESLQFVYDYCVPAYDAARVKAAAADPTADVSKRLLATMVVGTFSDLAATRTVSVEEMLALAARVGGRYMEVSALTNSNVREAFQQLAADMLAAKDNRKDAPCGSSGGSSGSGGAGVCGIM